MSFALKLACVSFALITVFVAPQIGGAVTSEPVSVAFAPVAPIIGRSIALHAQIGTTAATQVYFYVGDDSVGTTTVTIAGQTVVLPVANAVLNSIVTSKGGVAAGTHYIPRDRSLLGQQRKTVAAVVQNGQVVVSSMSASGPILGDDIS
jgi:hypothetical protein